MRSIVLTLCVLSPWPVTPLGADGPPTASKTPDAASTDTVDTADASRIDVAKLVAETRDSIVVISVSGRDGGASGVGTGFVIDGDGLIATNLHVIGEGRPIRVQRADGKQLTVTSVHASDRFQDLAILRVDTGGERLPSLKLSGDGQPEDGLPIVVIGNPHGLRHSVVEGVVSSVREIDGRQLVQLAVPVEPGNSGGPVLDARGEVRGIVTLKSAVTSNLGFAVEVAPLKRLLAEPNPVPINRWETIGVVDPEAWQPLFGANWRQRGGVIHVDGKGTGFGGRALSLSRLAPPEQPYELAVSVRLDDESGAAGLVFHSNGDDKHYGFYPSNGRLRLTCFRGPTVFTWQVLHEMSSADYRPGDWNHLKVRVEEGKLTCYVNDRPVIESSDDSFRAGQVGLAKFRDTKAEFKDFRLGREIARSQPDDATADRIEQLVANLSPRRSLLDKEFEPLTDEAEMAAIALGQRAKQLERQAGRMRWLANQVHVRAVTGRLRNVVEQDARDFDLIRAALLIAQLDGEEIDVESYVRQVDRMAVEIQESLDDRSDDAARRTALDRYLFRENGFHGSRFDYDHRANSYLNRVIDDREGLPITLSVLYMELGKRIGIDVEGVGLPGHFVVRHNPSTGASQLIDVFAGGADLTRDQAADKVMAFTGRRLDERHLAASSKQEIILRMLRNLIGNAEAEDDRERLLRYVEAIVAVDPDSAEHRGIRAVLRFENGLVAAAIADLDVILADPPAGMDLERVRQMRQYFEAQADE